MKEKNHFPILHPNAAGIDIASKEHFVAVNPEQIDDPIRSFGAYTEDLHAIVKWLKECNVDTIAMEATGIYWVSLFLVLEDAGFEVLLVNARHVKNVRGKKTDMKDAEWIRQLHSCGLLTPSFQPDSFTRTLRTYMRHRKNLIEMASTHIRMMHKALEQMNVKFQHVLTDITGKSGQEIIKGIINGERDAEKLAAYCDGRIKKSKKSEVIKSLNGIWKEENVFELQQSFDLYHIYRNKISDCDQKIQQLLCIKTDLDSVPTNPAIQTNKNNLSFDGQLILKQILGIDLTACHGLTSSNSIELLSEIGFNLHKWPTAKHFTSWLNLAPNNKVSGGKVIKTRREKKKCHAAQIFKMAAQSVIRSNHWLAHFYQRIKARSGAGKANVATARKIAVIFYNMITKSKEFIPIPNTEYERKFMESQIMRLKKKAGKLGMAVVPIQVT